MKLIIALLFISYLFWSCKRDQVLDSEVPNIHYAVALQDQKIAGYTKYVDDSLTETMTFTFNDSLAERIIKNRAGEAIRRTIYLLDSTGYAISSIDSFIEYDLLKVTATNYTYDAENFLTESESEYIINADTNSYIIEYIVENENTVKIIRLPYRCTTSYTYTDLPNILDIENFEMKVENEITGRKSKNLKEWGKYGVGCPGGPSYSYPEYNFTYTLDEKQRVIEQRIFDKHHYLKRIITYSY